MTRKRTALQVKVFGAWLDADVAGRKAGRGNRAAELKAKAARGEALTQLEKGEVFYEEAISYLEKGLLYFHPYSYCHFVKSQLRVLLHASYNYHNVSSVCNSMYS